MSDRPIQADTPTAVAGRIRSVDALRGLVMLVMIFVNDLGDVPGDVVPWWMKHYRGENGLTFVDLVFPAFLFIVGMSLPFALGSRLNKGEARWRTGLHVLGRTLSLLFLGILMVNGTPDTEKMGWSGSLWVTLMFLAAICAFGAITPGAGEADERAKRSRVATLMLRSAGWAAMVFLTFTFRHQNGQPIITLWPFNIRHSWYGILGYIGWAYLTSAIVFLLFRTNRTALLGCVVLMMCLYPANKQGMFGSLWMAKHINIGVALGSRAAIAGTGLLLGAMLSSPGGNTAGSRARFTLLLTAGCAAAAWLLGGLYGVSKETATPSWALWGCAVTAGLWLVFYFVVDVHPVGVIARPLTLAGQNVLLAYLISEMVPALLGVLGLTQAYEGLAQPALSHAVIRSSGCALVVLSAAVGLNRIGFRVRL